MFVLFTAEPRGGPGAVGDPPKRIVNDLASGTQIFGLAKYSDACIAASAT